MHQNMDSLKPINWKKNVSVDGEIKEKNAFWMN